MTGKTKSDDQVLKVLNEIIADSWKKYNSMKAVEKSRFS